MALFSERPTEKISGGDAATRALSSTVVENAFVERVYEKLSGVYDLTFGPTLHPGRLQALERMAIGEGRSVFEVPALITEVSVVELPEHALEH